MTRFDSFFWVKKKYDTWAHTKKIHLDSLPGQGARRNFGSVYFCCPKIA